MATESALLATPVTRCPESPCSPIPMIGPRSGRTPCHAVMFATRCRYSSLARLPCLRRRKVRSILSKSHSSGLQQGSEALTSPHPAVTANVGFRHCNCFVNGQAVSPDLCFGISCGSNPAEFDIRISSLVGTE